ncbi:MAG: shikimate dehydrogenase [Rikenellaceae bacterium]
MIVKKLGLIGFPLGHSFSKRYFTHKFESTSLCNWSYHNYPMESVDQIREVLSANPNLVGFNVTIPHKIAIIPYLSEIDQKAKSIGAVNCVKVLSDGRLAGYNTDFTGFKVALLDMIGSERPNAIVLGTGGASKAVMAVLDSLEMEYTLVSRNSGANQISYDQLSDELISSSKLIINATPLGMYPKIDGIPQINYSAVGSSHFLFDLIFNPDETRFMREGRVRGAVVKNGYQMLVEQAEAWWSIINK